MNIRLFFSFGVLVGGVCFAQAQTPATPASTGPANESPAERNLRRSREAETRGLAEAFRGITAAGVAEPELFPLRSTGVSTDPVRKAAVRWLGLLTPEQRATSTFPVNDPEWRKWMNQHFYVRQGVSFKDMTGPQREAAFDLMRTAMSAKGLKLSQDIMKLNHTLGELNQDDFVNYGEWLYHVTVMGEPSATQPWGWQVGQRLDHQLLCPRRPGGDDPALCRIGTGHCSLRQVQRPEHPAAGAGRRPGYAACPDPDSGPGPCSPPPKPATTIRPKRSATTSSCRMPVCGRRPQSCATATPAGADRAVC